MTIAAGTKLGRYEIRSKIGAGGMGEVYRARDEKLNRNVAIKVLPGAPSQDGRRRRQFEQEGQAAAPLIILTFLRFTMWAPMTMRLTSSQNCSKVKSCVSNSAKARSRSARRSTMP